MYIKAVVMQAETDKNKFILDLQEIERHLVFYKFGEDKPQLCLDEYSNIMLKYNGKEMSSDEFVERMEEFGYISKDDFE